MIDNHTRSAIIGGMRRVWHRHPFRIAALKAAEVRVTPTNKDGSKAKRDHVFYTCAECGCLGKTAGSDTHQKVAVDHKIPVMPTDRKLTSLDEIAARMFVEGPEYLAVLCETCHTLKTTAEAKLRREAKKELHGDAKLS